MASNTTHRGSTGVDHGYIDQDVTSASTPTFTGTNFTGIPWAGVSKTGSNLNEMVTRSHTVLSDIGSNAHSVIDTHLAVTDGNPHGVDTADLSLTESIQIQIELTVGEEIQYVAPFSMSITGWTMLLDVSGSAAIDVWKDTYANYPPLVGDSIVTPSVTSDTDNQATGLSIAVTAGDCIIFHVDSATTSELATLALTGVRT